jgi:hypothetical protein
MELAHSVAQVCYLRDGACDSEIFDVCSDNAFQRTPAQVTNLRCRMCAIDFWEGSAGGISVLIPTSAHNGEIPACGCVDLFEQSLTREKSAFENAPESTISSLVDI